MEYKDYIEVMWKSRSTLFVFDKDMERVLSWLIEFNDGTNLTLLLERWSSASGWYISQK